jgi:hypothetical protein
MMIYWHFHIWSHTTSHTCRPVGRIRSGHVPIVCGDCLGKLLRSILASPQFWRTLMLVCIVHCQAAAAKNQLLQFLSRFFSEGEILMGHGGCPIVGSHLELYAPSASRRYFLGPKGAITATESTSNYLPDPQKHRELVWGAHSINLLYLCN